VPSTPPTGVPRGVDDRPFAHLLRDPEHGEKILGRFPGEDTETRIIWLLGKTRRKGMMRELFRYLDDEDGDVRAAAVGALAKYRVGLIANHLRKSLTDPNPRVRAAAVNALSRFKPWRTNRKSRRCSPTRMCTSASGRIGTLADGFGDGGGKDPGIGRRAHGTAADLAGRGFFWDHLPPEAAVNPDTARFLGNSFRSPRPLRSLGVRRPGQRKRAFRALQSCRRNGPAGRPCPCLRTRTRPAGRGEDWLERRAH